MIKSNKIIFYTVIISIMMSLINNVLPFFITTYYLDNVERLNGILFSIEIIIALIGFVCVGIYIIKKATFSDVRNATIVFTMYIAIAFVLQHFIQRLIGYSWLLILLFFPISMFTAFPKIIIWQTKSPIILFVISSILFPCIFFVIKGIAISFQSWRNNNR
ncbi:hypothetical protein EDC19_1818 [Natranaerovirga hydrolytica]|uniref:Uncharacterized protein n=1 Tax=Natranaerovirga hydrolytica TaxID=680378 RepID=A0A4R1MJN9_9FIRM|nr:hypothetical protein EDC19_1818 [Natranaerovirga hydrolytica]